MVFSLNNSEQRWYRWLWIITIRIPLTLAKSHLVEEEIIKRFPQRRLAHISHYHKLIILKHTYVFQGYYRVSKRGKIYNKYCNVKSSFNSTFKKRDAPTENEGLKKKFRHTKTFGKYSIPNTRSVKEKHKIFHLWYGLV